MARISIRFFVEDAELDRIDADLPADASEIVAACREWVDDWMAASRPPSEDEAATFEEAFARQFGVSRQSLDERIRAEQALADRMLENRRRAEETLAGARAGKEIELPKPVPSDRVAYAQRMLKERDQG